MKIGIHNWAMGGAALALGGAALYLYFRGAKGVTKDAVKTTSNIISGVVEGTGEAFQDLSQSTFGISSTYKPEDKAECQQAIAAGQTFRASYKCPAATWIKSLFASGPVVTATDAQTAPGGGLWSPSERTFSSIFTSPNDGSGWVTFENPVPNPLPGSVKSGFLPVDWGQNYAPSQPVIFGTGSKKLTVSKHAVNDYGVTTLFPVAGMRG